MNSVKQNIVHILYATDINAVLELSASIISLLKNAKIETRYDISIIVEKNIDDSVKGNLKVLENIHPGTNISFISLKDGAFNDVKIFTKHISKAAYYRLLAGEVLLDVDRCIYLDCDTIVMDDLADLYNLNIKDNLLAGVKAAGYYYPEKFKREKEEELGIKINTYVNSGVLLMNLKQIRKDNVLEKFLSLSKMNFKSEDQDVINVACCGRIMALPLKFNMMIKYFNETSGEVWKGERIYSIEERKAAFKKPVIIHYADKEKPWNKFTLCKAEEWWRYAELSPLLSTECFSMLEKYLDYKKKNSRKKFAFSIVMAVYNTKKYLGEAIESVIKQDVGFEQNVQLFLVNDGSSDGSGEVCEEWAKKHPDNICVLHQMNAGVSVARNRGMLLAEGNYINFLDSDDKLSAETLRSVKCFFEKHGDETDFVAIPVQLFDAARGRHFLDGRKSSKGTRVIDLSKESNVIQNRVSEGFIKKEALFELRFDTRLKYSEDAKMCIQALLPKSKLGFVTEACYYYRKRGAESNSAVDGSRRSYDWYIPTLRYFTFDVIAYVNDRVGSVPRFVQNTLFWDLIWRYLADRKVISDVLGKEGTKKYFEMFYQSLRYIDDEVIIQMAYLSDVQKKEIIHEKRMALSKKCDLVLTSSLGRNDTRYAMKMEYVFPAYLFNEGDKVVMVGNQKIIDVFVEQNASCKFVEIIAKYNLQPEYGNSNREVLESIRRENFNVLLIAEENKEVASRVKRNLIECGMRDDCIKWDGENYRYTNFYKNMYLPWVRRMNILGREV